MQQYNNNRSDYNGNTAGTRPHSATTIFSETMDFDVGEVHCRFYAKPIGTANQCITPMQKGMIGVIGTELFKNFVRGAVTK